MLSIFSLISNVATAVCLAKSLISPATTANPLPASPARAASMVAFNASRLVCSEMSLMVSTTFPSDIDAMRVMFPKLDIRKDVLFVHDGKYITSAGGAKSFEAALYLCEFLYGKEIAQSLAGGLVIDWNVENVPHIIIDK